MKAILKRKKFWAALVALAVAVGVLDQATGANIVAAIGDILNALG